MGEPSRFTLEEAQIMPGSYRNFAGREGPYNSDRTFCLILPEDVAATLAEDGWNVKETKPRDDDEDEYAPTLYLPVKINYENRPPRITTLTSTGKTLLNENTVDTLDYADIISVDVIINPSKWANNGKSGVKAYLKTMYVKIDEDDLERKYAEEIPHDDVDEE